jgi:hypothetical protein
MTLRQVINWSCRKRGERNIWNKGLLFVQLLIPKIGGLNNIYIFENVGMVCGYLKNNPVEVVLFCDIKKAGSTE